MIAVRYSWILRYLLEYQVLPDTSTSTVNYRTYHTANGRIDGCLASMPIGIVCRSYSSPWVGGVSQPTSGWMASSLNPMLLHRYSHSAARALCEYIPISHSGGLMAHSEERITTVDHGRVAVASRLSASTRPRQCLGACGGRRFGGCSGKISAGDRMVGYPTLMRRLRPFPRNRVGIVPRHGLYHDPRSHAFPPGIPNNIVIPEKWPGEGPLSFFSETNKVS
ncbi:hypothetical protein HOY80DRAFT_366147 [Tuber brumale]|nr:hypothetical protein HOY80DRAFT_366147 [Tuber brumale]